MPGKRRREPFSISKPGRRWRDDTLEASSRRTPVAGAKGPSKPGETHPAAQAVPAVNHVLMRGSGAAAPALSPSRLFLLSI